MTAYEQTASWQATSGEYYDWTQTRLPERPYIHDYSRTLTTKLALSVPNPDGGSRVFNTFEQALGIIQETDRLTRGIPKILYLVGWQYNGHDDKYPAMDEVNPALKRAEDATARDSYLWLVREAKRWNTTVSVHANVTDAYDDSPLWDTYVRNELISRNEDGALMQIGCYNDKAAYQICYKHEWELGFAVQRMERLIDLLQLEQVGTVHFDAYFPRANVYHNISQEEETSYMRRLIRYMRNRGIDVTSENFNHLRIDPLLGLQPWTWWFDQNQEEHFVERPAALSCGAIIRDYSQSGIPLRHDLMFLFGASMHGEDIYSNHSGEPSREKWHSDFLEQFCLTTLTYQFLNTHDRLRLEGKDEERVMYYSNGLSVHLADRTVRQDGRILREGDDGCMPALWAKSPEMIAYSKSGYLSRHWTLPPEWDDVTEADIYAIDAADNALPLQRGVRIDDRTIDLRLPPASAVSIVPSANTR